MKRLPLLAFSIITLVSSALCAQDPGFRPAEAPRMPVAPAAAPTPPPEPVSTGASTTVAKLDSMERLDSTYVIGTGDTLSLRIVEEGEKVYSLLVQDSGNIQAPYIGLVPVSGKTCKDVAFAMKSELQKQHFKVATVILALEKENPLKKKKGAPGAVGPAAPGFVTIYGQVQRQGRYEVEPDEDLTVSQAVLRAGGFAQFANESRVKVIRRYPNKGNVTFIVNLKDVMMRGKLEYDIPVKGGDVIIVDEKMFNF